MVGVVGVVRTTSMRGVVPFGTTMRGTACMSTMGRMVSRCSMAGMVTTSCGSMLGRMMTSSSPMLSRMMGSSRVLDRVEARVCGEGRGKSLAVESYVSFCACPAPCHLIVGGINLDLLFLFIYPKFAQESYDDLKLHLGLICVHWSSDLVFHIYRISIPQARDGRISQTKLLSSTICSGSIIIQNPFFDHSQYFFDNS